MTTSYYPRKYIPRTKIAFISFDFDQKKKKTFSFNFKKHASKLGSSIFNRRHYCSAVFDFADNLSEFVVKMFRKNTSGRGVSR